MKLINNKFFILFILIIYAYLLSFLFIDSSKVANSALNDFLYASINIYLFFLLFVGIYIFIFKKKFKKIFFLFLLFFLSYACYCIYFYLLFNQKVFLNNFNKTIIIYICNLVVLSVLFIIKFLTYKKS